MTDDEFDAFVETANQELDQKQDALMKKFRLGQWEDFWFDQTKGCLQFKDSKGRVQVEATVTPIGSFSEESGTWQWGWANQSLVEPLRRKSEKLKGLFDRTGIEVFRMKTVKMDEAMAWQTAAMSVSHLGALGCYQIPTGKLRVFVAIDSIKRAKSPSK